MAGYLDELGKRGDGSVWHTVSHNVIQPLVQPRNSFAVVTKLCYT
jgi:hypothetical protein